MKEIRHFDKSKYKSIQAMRVTGTDAELVMDQSIVFSKSTRVELSLSLINHVTSDNLSFTANFTAADL